MTVGAADIKEDHIVLYLCDWKKNIECKKTNCWYYGGDCHHTDNPSFAKNFDYDAEHDIFEERVPND